MAELKFDNRANIVTLHINTFYLQFMFINKMELLSKVAVQNVLVLNERNLKL